MEDNSCVQKEDVHLGLNCKCEESLLRDETCLFCKLSKNNKLIIYENKHLYVILDRFPSSNRHFLLISKDHYPYLHENSDCSLVSIILTAKRLVKAFEMKSYNLVQNNINEQMIPHCHFHLIEANSTGKFSSDLQNRMTLNDEEYENLAKELVDTFKKNLKK